MRIPTREEHISMNLGQAVAVCLYELIRDPKKTAAFERLPEKLMAASAGEVERFTNILTEALSLSGFSIAARWPTRTTGFAGWCGA